MSNNFLANTVAGLMAGGISTLAMHPLDLIKTRMQVSGGQTISVIRDTYQVHGFRGLYRGLGTNLFGGMIGWGFYFAWYGQIKNLLAHEGHLTGTEYLMASGSAGILTSLCTNPIWVVKTRMLTTNHGDSLAYSSFVDGLQKIAQQEGLQGLYRGLIPSLFGVTHGALQFTFYEMLKDRRKGQLDIDHHMTTLDYLQVSAISKLAATSLTYPYQVLRSRLQVHNVEPSLGVSTVLRQIIETQGLRGLYRGLTPNLLRVVPTTCITMVIYEQVNSWIVKTV